MTRLEIEELLGCKLAIAVGELPPESLSDVRLFYAVGEPSDVYICCLEDTSGYEAPSDELCDIAYNIVSETLAKRGVIIGPIVDVDSEIAFYNPETEEVEMIRRIHRWHNTAIVDRGLIDGYTD